MISKIGKKFIAHYPLLLINKRFFKILSLFNILFVRAIILMALPVVSSIPTLVADSLVLLIFMAAETICRYTNSLLII